MGLSILLTGSAGVVGSHVLRHLLEEGHSVTATDIVAEEKLPAAVRESLNHPNCTYTTADLTSLPDIDSLFEQSFNGVIHLGAVPNPRPELDDRTLHSNNVVGSYNVLRTAVDRGIKRIVQASSVNAHGLSYSKPEHVCFDKFPIDEDVERRDEDAYALSKHICEIQADSLVRLDPTVRIASIRPHMVRESYEKAVPDCEARHLFSWVSTESLARACVLGITSSGWDGHQVFNIVAPEICWEGSVTNQASTPQDTKVPTLDLVGHYCAYKPHIDVEYFAKNPRAAIWTCDKAERLLGWRHKP